jgi:predicted SprT family Zn-dependent metalloprotease
VTTTLDRTMTVDTLFARTKELLRENGFKEYVSVGWHRGSRHIGRAVERFGVSYQITYSRRAVLAMTPRQIFETMTHEVAHILVGGNHGHNGVWRAMDLELGGSGQVSADDLTYDQRAKMYKWVGKCQACPTMYFRERLTTRTRLYGYCNDCRSALDWTSNW